MRLASPKVQAPISPDRHAEAQQKHRGITFTEFGPVALNVRTVENGRLTLERHGTTLRPLPETLDGILDAIEDGSIPRPTPRRAPWEVTTLQPSSNQADKYIVFLDREGTEVHIQDQATGKGITLQTAYLEEIVQSIVHRSNRDAQR